MMKFSRSDSRFDYQSSHRWSSPPPVAGGEKREGQRMSGISRAVVSQEGEPIPTSAVLMASWKHIGSACRTENAAFINCKKKDPNPEKCLDRGREVTSCVLGLLKNLHQSCTKEMDAYAGCMYYNTNEFEMCRKEQEDFEKACPLSSL